MSGRTFRSGRLWNPRTPNPENLKNPKNPANLYRSLLRRQFQHLSRLDLVGVAQLILVRVEDLHVGVRVAERFLRDLAQRVARLDGVGAHGAAGGADGDGLSLRHHLDV